MHVMCEGVPIQCVQHAVLHTAHVLQCQQYKMHNPACMHTHSFPASPGPSSMQHAPQTHAHASAPTLIRACTTRMHVQLPHCVYTLRYMGLKRRTAAKRPPKRKQVDKRTAYLVELLKLTKPPQHKAAAKAAGFKLSKNFHSRAVNKFAQQGNVLNAPRARQQSVNKPEVCKEAFDILAASHRPLTSKELHKKLTTLPPGEHDVRQFLRVFKMFCSGLGHRVNTFSRRTKVSQHLDDPADRVRYCEQTLQALCDGSLSLDDMVFMDETTVLEKEHPKGMNVCEQCWSCFNSHLCAFWLCSG